MVYQPCRTPFVARIGRALGEKHRCLARLLSRDDHLLVPISTFHQANRQRHLPATREVGKPVDISMGYSPLEGLIMGTRAGDLDPGVLLHLLHEGWDAERLGRLLHHEAGLKALAGTADMRELLLRTDAEAQEAVEIFCYRAVKYVGAYLAALEGEAQALVFTGGIGENAAEIRERICRSLEWAGVRLDPRRNARGKERISAEGSPLGAYAIRTDEEAGIAEEALRLLQESPTLHL